MKKVRSKNTSPELAVRKIVFAMGYRYRLHSKNLPGKPDLVFASRKKVIFVHGCYWHFHQCEKGRAPKSNLDYWLPKLEENRRRDDRNQKAIEAMGWQSLVIWQCEIRNITDIEKVISSFLEGE